MFVLDEGKRSGRNNKKMGLQNTKSGEETSPSKRQEEEEEYSDSDDVRVVGEVSTAKKYPRGAVIGPHRLYAVSTSQIKKRRRPETNNVVKYSSVRRPLHASSLRQLCNSSVIKRRLFQMEESIRLEERRQYVELIKMMGVSMVIMSANIIRNHLSQHICNVPPRYEQESKYSKVVPKSPTHSVECVDLVSDSEDDVVMVPRESRPGPSSLRVKDISIEEIPTASDVSVIDIEELDITESTQTTSILKISEGPNEPECVECISTSSEQLNDGTPDDLEKECINLEEEDDSEPKSNLEDQMLHQMILHDHAKPCEEEEDDLEESLPEITPEMQVLVFNAFCNKSEDILVNAFSLAIQPKDIHTLKGNNWLNDQVINFYMCLLMERGKLCSYPSVYCFNTFFYVKLKSSGHGSLKRWTRKDDLFSYELLIVPVHLKVHWCLACINFIEKRIEYYDSMRGRNDECGEMLLKYLQDEHFDKKKEAFNTSGWEIVNMEDIPEQLNGSDCGVFLCTYAEYICRLAKLSFTQRDMPYFRVKMAYEILTKKLVL